MAAFASFIDAEWWKRLYEGTDSAEGAADEKLGPSSQIDVLTWNEKILGQGARINTRYVNIITPRGTEKYKVPINIFCHKTTSITK